MAFISISSGSRWADDDFVDVHIVRLFDGVAHRAADRVRLQGDGPVALHQFGGGRVGDGVGEFAFHHAGVNAGDTQVAVFLPQPVEIARTANFVAQ